MKSARQTVTDTLIPDLSIQSVEAEGTSVTINGQTVTVVYPSLGAGQTVSVSIFTIVTNGITVENTVCISDVCATGQVIAKLPETGETPFGVSLIRGLLQKK